MCADSGREKKKKVAYNRKLLAHYVPLNSLGQPHSHSTSEPQYLVEDLYKGDRLAVFRVDHVWLRLEHAIHPGRYSSPHSGARR
jgi:hypothetical protein